MRGEYNQWIFLSEKMVSTKEIRKKYLDFFKSKSGVLCVLIVFLLE
jgi:hypothetical protein